jgi:C1A family cysteine protease
MTRIYNLKTEKLTHVPKKMYKVANLPPQIDLRNEFGPVYNQGTLGSCTANAILSAVHFIDPKFYGSRLFLYWNERSLNGDINTDSGSTISAGVTVISTIGMCSENIWPYDISAYQTKPPDICFTKAKLHMATQYEHIDATQDSIKSCLASGFPIVVGITVYQSFETENVTNTGIVPMPTSGEKILGGHAVVICGYDDNKQWWIMRNSWGSLWGHNGYFYLPYAYLTDNNLASDLWNITKVIDNESSQPEPTPDPSGKSSCSCTIL